MGSQLNPDPKPAANERGQQIVHPGDFDLFIDIDSELDYQYMLARLDDLRSHSELTLTLIGVTESRSGLPHRHVYLQSSQALSPLARIALQASLGSDRVREFLSILRIYKGGPGTTFFESPDWKDPR